MRLSLSRACSRARVEDGRPMTNGIIMCGKTTTSRNGTIGRVSYTSNGDSKLASLLDERDGLVSRHHDVARDRDLANLFLVWHLVHQVQHELFDDHPQAARPDLALERRLGD